ncbi:GNAT family N-acetyltransferase [Nesterenkonia sandarakina]|uniref:Aminoglycoside 6'-N-acetyltransferase I n=1 Tax=Nesterenkonia sandarakina TaxID=272918 RepID=A0A7Z0J4K0_9MICC|nr:aminoglycoside 6'-N-acetyltransferase I [Nesterenkonia sandarakina]
MLIRSATPDDVESARRISVASGRERWEPNVFVPMPDRLVLVAELEGELVGVAKTHSHREPDSGSPAGHYLGGVMVTPTHRRRGVAAALTQTRLNWIWSLSDHAYYFTNEHNTASIQLHATFGFSSLGRFPAIHGATADNGASRLILFAARKEQPVPVADSTAH